MDDDSTTSTDDHAKALASALSKRGVTNDDPDLTHDPIAAAREAYSVMFEGATPGDFHDYLQKLKDLDGRGLEYHRRLAVVCRNALEQKDVSRRDVARFNYALGYFEGIAAVIRDGADIGA